MDITDSSRTRRRKVSEWKSIETAPKDGRNILLCANGRVDEGGWVTQEDEEGAPEFMGWWWTLGTDPVFTHWMPLPAPPEVNP